MARCYIGLPQLRGKLETYASKYDIVELQPGDTPLPKGKKLEQWRQQVPPSFAFSVVLPRVVGDLGPPNGSADEALADSLDVATVLQARCIVLETPSGVRPTKTNRQRLVDLASKLPRPGFIACWRPNGIWELDDIANTAQSAGLLPVLDAAMDPLPPGPIAYTRVRALGMTAMVGANIIERIAAKLRNRRESFVIVDSTIAGAFRSQLVAAIDRQGQPHPVVPLMRPGQAATLSAEDEEQ